MAALRALRGTRQLQAALSLSQRGAGLPLPLPAAVRWHKTVAADDGAEKISFHFKLRDGSRKTVSVPSGVTVLEAAHMNEVDLEGACEASLACSTCHDLLDLAPCLTPTSRLACQVVVDEKLRDHTVTLPAMTLNFYVDGHVISAMGFAFTSRDAATDAVASRPAQASPPAVARHEHHGALSKSTTSSRAASPALGTATRNGSGTQKQDLTKWWGKVAFEDAVQNAHHDVHLAGFTLCSPAAQHAENTLRKLLRRHQSGQHGAGGACSDLPVQIAQHAWRYKEDLSRTCQAATESVSFVQEELSRCLDLAPGESCIMACQDFPGLQAALKCDGANLTGIPPPGDCRYQFDPDIVHAPSGSMMGLLRRVPLKWPSGEETSALVRTFWGIPYGEEPVRFQAAKAKAKWMGGQQGQQSPSAEDFYVELPGLNCAPADFLQDCLQLHVYAPHAPAPKTRPVFIFLIPGGFIGTDFFQKGWYDAARFAVRNDAIFISVGYRSGFLGHWVHEQLAEEELFQRSVHSGVQKNIQSFGGDPGRVTLAGHSSGAFSVNFHLLSPGSRGLFAHGILEGTALETCQGLGHFFGDFLDSGWYYSTKDDGLRFYATLAEQLGCSGADQIRCLRALPVDSFYNFSNVTYHEELGKIKGLGKWGLAKGLAGAAWSALGFEGSFRSKGLQLGDVPILAGPLWPVLSVGYIVDGSEAGLPAPPRQLYESGRVNPAKVYLNHGTDEGTVFALIMYAAYPWYEAPSLSHAATDEIMTEALLTEQTWAFNGSVPQLYPHGRGDSAPFYRMSRAIADSTFVCPHRRYATALSKLMPNSVFYAETTFAGDDMQDSNWLSAAIHRALGITAASSTASDAWCSTQDDLPRPGDLSYFVGAWHMNQVLWIFGVNDTLKVCNSTKPTNLGFDYASWRSEDELMHQLEAEGGARFAMTPYGKPKLVSPSAEEERVCAWWDDAAPTHFITSACRGCAAKHVKDTVVGTFVDRRNES
eukprot:s419_g5.t1